jgi:hypothetical protein
MSTVILPTSPFSTGQFGPSPGEILADATFEQAETDARQAIAAYRRLEENATVDDGEFDGKEMG